ncbi:hypothetical protein HNQ07_001970 [Deinococcus metalli]|uniref:PatA-like N-terminal domain-containing protein n=1 Tax=Deinococcus metalli TaxID=1141878 RepID=A0A7W8NP73_9DEIO|nr:DUF4388 domain-containing protein [Deinococcus metalli]MBB5376506.1 hypothetical protein [Deinococcus metalli]GHF43522.1 hypothetical protein GCM10017781_19950 [Deinococcus metalli]
MTGTPSPTATILTGLLLPGDNSLPMLLDYLHQCGRTGALLIHTPYGMARVYFDEGQLHHAAFQQHTGLHAIAVLMQVHDRAAFMFQLDQRTADRSITTSLGHLLMNAAQILDEGHAPPLDTTATPDAGGATTAQPSTPPVALAPSVPDIGYDLVPALTVTMSALGPVDDAHRHLLSLINARRSVAELARATRLNLDEVTALLRPFVMRGEITLGPPLLHQTFWIELLRLMNTVAGKDGDRIIADALRRVDASPGAIPIARGRAFLQGIEQDLGPVGSPRRTAFGRGTYRLRMMILNATNTTEEEWNTPEVS